MSTAQIIAEVCSADGWAGLVEGFRLAVEARNTTYERTSELAGLPGRYVNKLLAPRPEKNIGPKSLGPLMGATAVKILIVVDEEMLVALSRRFVDRKPGPKRHAHGTMPTRKRRRKSAFRGNSAWGRAMISRRILMTKPKQRKSLARKAARARWRKPRIVEIKGAAARAARSKAIQLAAESDRRLTIADTGEP